jgi:hypothetical protein
MPAPIRTAPVTSVMAGLSGPAINIVPVQPRTPPEHNMTHTAQEQRAHLATPHRAPARVLSAVPVHTLANRKPTR